MFALIHYCSTLGLKGKPSAVPVFTGVVVDNLLPSPTPETIVCKSDCRDERARFLRKLFCVGQVASSKVSSIGLAIEVL